MKDLTRREALARGGRSLAAGVLASAFPAWGVLEAWAREQGPRMGPFAHAKGSDRGEPARRELDPRFYTRLEGGRAQCRICPLNCVLNEGETCFCRTRNNVGGRLYSYAWNNPATVSVDPIEKLPLSHFLPGAGTLALGTGGCNLRCQYCQNHEISQARPERLEALELDVERALATAGKKEVRTFAYTYSEPVAYYEYMLDLAERARAAKMRNVAATALFVEPEPLKNWAKWMDGFAVTLKGFDEEFYRVVLGASLAPVLKALETLKATGVWFEIVALIAPTYNDDPAKVRAMCRWIARSLGRDLPLHLGRFEPAYQMKTVPRTPVTTLERCRDIAREEGLRYVYLFNVTPHEGEHTYCPECRKAVIERQGFRVTAQRLKDGRCPCGHKIPGVWS